MTKTKRSLRSAATALVVTALLSGCAGYSRNHFVVGSVPDDYRQRHPIVIAEREQTMDIPVGSDTQGLSFAQQGSVAGFAGEYARRPNGPLRIMLPSGSANAHVASAIGPEIVEALVRGGAGQSRIEIMHYDASRHGDAAPVRLSYHAVSAGVPGECNKWNTDLGHNPENRQYHNFGCASQKNLAAIVANPSDLLAPRGQTGIDGKARARAIEAYQNGG